MNIPNFHPNAHRTRAGYDEWTIDSWRLEPRLRALDLDESSASEQAPPLWKDLTLASVVALLLWVAAVAIFR